MHEASERVGVVTSDQGLAQRCRSAALHGVRVMLRERLYANAANGVG